MPRTDQRKVKADWRKFERRPSFSAVSSRELSQVLGISLQTVCNWRMRGILPEPVRSINLPTGNKVWYRISTIRAWLEDRTEEEIHWDWARCWLDGYLDGVEHLWQVEYLVKNVPDLFGVERPLLPLVV